MYKDPLEKIYKDLWEHTEHLLEEHDLPVEAVAGSLMAIAMRLYKSSLSEENFNKIKDVQSFLRQDSYLPAPGLRFFPVLNVVRVGCYLSRSSRTLF